jgi:hypothetical protein
MPSASISVLLPAPGTPVMAIRLARPVCGRIASSRSAAGAASSARSLSTSVIARASVARWPRRTPSM